MDVQIFVVDTHLKSRPSYWVQHMSITLNIKHASVLKIMSKHPVINKLVFAIQIHSDSRKGKLITTGIFKKIHVYV